VSRADKKQVKKERRRNGQGTIDELGPNYFRLRWREPDPLDLSKTRPGSHRFHGTRTEAERELGRIQAMADAGKYRPRSMTLQDLSEEFLADRQAKGRRFRTLESYEDTLRVHVLPELGKCLIDQVSPMMCFKLLMAKKSQVSKNGRPFSKVSINDMQTVMNMVFNYAKKQKYVETNPVADLVLPDGDPNEPPDLQAIRTRLAKPAVLTHTWRQKFIEAAAADEFYVAFCIAIENGKRRGEIWAIKWVDIDFATGVILIYKSLQRQRGQGIKPGPLKGKKNGEKKVSFIVVGPQILELLKKHRERQLANKAAMGERYSDDGWVFCHPDSGMPYDPKVLQALQENLRPDRPPCKFEAARPPARLRHSQKRQGRQLRGDPAGPGS
jgi:integrase